MMDIQLERDSNLTEQAIILMKEYYMLDDETSPQQAFARASEAYSYGDINFAQKIYDYVSKGWFMFSSPILSNAPKRGEKFVGLPISCFLCYVPDTIEGLIKHTDELRWLSVKGGGIGGHWSNVRSVSTKSPGPIPFIHTVDADMTAYRQGKTRKGSYAAYLDISHPDIVEFLHMRIPTGDVNRKNFNLHHAVNITDKFMESVESNSTWDLIDPHSTKIKATLKARFLWELILEIRYRTGEPYLNFIDTSNKYLSEPLKRRGLKIRGSNLCNEIHLPTDENRTAVCCLSSVNLEYYDEWKNTTIIQDLIKFLDNVLQIFIENSTSYLSYKARVTASLDRPLGLGACGLFSLFYRKEIDPESVQASILNNEIFKYIKNEAEIKTKQLAIERGEPSDMFGSGKRNSHLLAIAPNANSSIILGSSPSIEPPRANAYTHRTRIGSHLIKNKYLELELEKIGYNTDEVWKSIIVNGGSVYHLSFLPDETKAIFKTAIELDQETLIILAADRQRYICQGQSLNLFFRAGEERKRIHKIHFLAWKLGCKGLYYLRTEAKSRAENIETECLGCQG